MNPLLRDLYGHQEWADAAHWRAIEACAAARDDRTIRDRLHHIAIVQRAFFWIVGDRKVPFALTKPGDFAALADLKQYSRDHHAHMRETIATISDARLAETMDVPWFKDPTLTLTVTEALTQCAMHSQWHRGQNATRLRELGGDPPAVDLIVWFWKGRPAADWSG